MPRLRQPTATEKKWYNEVLKTHGPDFFSLPGYYADHYQYSHGRAVYPPEGASLSHGRTQMIQRYGKPHSSVWVRRLDLFFISVEMPDEEKIFTINLANVDRKMVIAAERAIAKELPEGATPEGQACWLMAYEIACDLLYTLNADMVWVSQFLQRLVNNDLELEEPIRANKPLFTRENMLEGLRLKKWHPFSSAERKFYRKQVLFTEHRRFTEITLNQHGFFE